MKLCNFLLIFFIPFSSFALTLDECKIRETTVLEKELGIKSTDFKFYHHEKVEQVCNLLICMEVEGEKLMDQLEKENRESTDAEASAILDKCLALMVK